MAQYLNRSNKFQTSRKENFTVKFMEDLETLVGIVAVEICQRHIKVGVDIVIQNVFTVAHYRRGALLEN